MFIFLKSGIFSDSHSGAIAEHFAKIAHNNNKKRSHTQLDSRKQVIAFQDRVIKLRNQIFCQYLK